MSYFLHVGEVLGVTNIHYVTSETIWFEWLPQLESKGVLLSQRGPYTQSSVHIPYTNHYLITNSIHRRISRKGYPGEGVVGRLFWVLPAGTFL